MKLGEYIFSQNFRRQTEFMDFANDIRNLINLGRYQMRIVTSVPDWTGEGGEHLLYISGSVRRLYFYDNVNATWQFIEWNTSGIGQSSIVATVSLTAQTGDITTTTLYTPAAAGFYKINVYHICQAAGAAGTLTTTIGWTDAVGAKTLSPASSIVLDSTNNGATGNAFISSTAAAITYATAIAGGSGSPAYNLYLALERLT